MEEHEFKKHELDRRLISGSCDKSRQKEFYEISSLKHLLKVLSPYTKGWSDFVSKVQVEKTETGFCYSTRDLLIPLNDKLTLLIFNEDQNQFTNHYREMTRLLHFLDEVAEKVEALKNKMTQTVNSQKLQHLVEKKIEMLDYLNSNELILFVFQNFYDSLKDIEPKQKPNKEIISRNYSEFMKNLGSSSGSMSESSAVADHEQRVNEFIVGQPIQDKPDQIIENSIIDEASLLLEKHEQSQELDFQAAGHWIDDCGEDLLNELLVYKKFKKQKKYKKQEEFDSIQETDSNQEEKLWFAGIVQQFQKGKRKLLEDLFDEKNKPGMEFSDIETLVKSLGGVIRYASQGSSHFRIILPKGVIGFSWRPHGKNAKSYKWYQLEGFREVFEKFGMTPKVLDEYQA